MGIQTQQMKRITSYLIIVIALLTHQATAQQKTFKLNDANWVIGIESIIPTGGYSVSKSISSGVVIEKPLGQFSVGLSMHYARTPEFYTYETIARISPETASGAISSRAKASRNTTLYDRTSAQQAYLMGGIELKYRLPCNCFFAYANVNHAEPINYQELSIDRIASKDDKSHRSYSDPSVSVMAIGVGVGANFPITKKMRGLIKAGKQYHNGFLGNDGRGRKEPFVVLTLGLQYGID